MLSSFHTLIYWGKRGLWFGIAIFLGMSIVRWGGVARPGPLLWLGIGMIVAMIGSFALLIWWLFASPLSALVVPMPSTSVDALLANRTAFLVLLAGFLFVNGTMWDEVWHRKLGGFGNDFLWPPHLLIYGSIALIVMFASGMFVLFWRGQGSIRERVRAAPRIGLLGLCAAFMVGSLPSDALWHEVYGRDITAWSLPHVLLIMSFSFVLLSGIVLQMLTIDRLTKHWPISRSIWSELMIIMLLSIMLLAQTQLWTAEYQSYSRSAGIPLQRGTSVFAEAFWQRPLWLLPALCAGVGTFHGMLAATAIKRLGAATMLGLIMLGCRALMLSTFQGGTEGMNLIIHVLMVIPLISIDVWYGFARLAKQADHPFLPSLLSGIIFVVLGLPTLSSLMSYPPVQPVSLPTMIMAILIGALSGGLAGSMLGRLLLTFAHQSQVAR